MNADMSSTDFAGSSLQSARLKQWLLEIVAVIRTECLALMACFPVEEQMRAGTLKEWAPKDEFAHLAFWLETFAVNLQNLRDGLPLIDTHDYLALNDQTWQQRKDWTWSQIQQAFTSALSALEVHVAQMRLEALTDASQMTLEAGRKSPRPLIRSFLYELVDHPLHHFVGLYRKLGTDAALLDMLNSLQGVLSQRGMAKWAATSRGKVRRYRQESALPSR